MLQHSSAKINLQLQNVTNTADLDKRFRQLHSRFGIKSRQRDR
jgi:hypothetical protein